MFKVINTLEDMTCQLLEHQHPNKPFGRKEIETAINQVALILQSNTGTIKESEKDYVAKKVEERFNIKMGDGVIFEEDYTPWLNEKRSEINWYYSERYRRLLKKKKFPVNVVMKLDSITDKILDHLEDPEKEGGWKRKGMVVGHVQSGKTANYIGLICKAADAGYKVIIVMAGLLNSLRNQTQARIDEGFIGKDSSFAYNSTTPDEGFIGVGEFGKDDLPVSLTNCLRDFNTNIARQVMLQLDSIKVPLVFCVKKHKSTLKNLIRWLKNNNRNLEQYPMLLIDDEADHASINTNKDPDEATAINKKIRELLDIFDKSSYVGYTATPFANIFIDPEPCVEIDDIFPKDFILTLDAPDNYVGPSNIFTEDNSNKYVNFIDDFEKWLPLKHKKEIYIDSISESLKEAICMFVLSIAIRKTRKNDNFNSSMLVNVSRFKDVQSKLKAHIEGFVRELRSSITNNYKLPATKALKNIHLKLLYNIFNDNYETTGAEWPIVQDHLNYAAGSIETLEINSNSDDSLDYSAKNYPKGRKLIAVGGLNLSRGLTLEGLTISYFLRNSMMYDTLMQMGRWFGYRDGYSDLCRIYMTKASHSWYLYISGVMDELRGEFIYMKNQGLTPKEFGLSVRTHPESLIVTARNKMRTGRKVVREISLWGKIVETSALSSKLDDIKSNFNALVLLLKRLGNPSEPDNRLYVKPGHLWQNIDSETIKEYLLSFRNHQSSQKTETKPLIDFITHLANNGYGQWDVFFTSPDSGHICQSLKEIPLGLKLQKRGIELIEDFIAISGKKRRIGGGQTDEKIGLEKDVIQNSNYQSARKLRELRTKPLLLLHALKDIENDFEYEFSGYGIIFPGNVNDSNKSKLVEYVVNTTWWNNRYGYEIEEDEEDNEDSYE